MKKKPIISRICQEFANHSGFINDPIANGTAILEISLSDYVEFIKWDCENLCMYQPDLKNPPPIMGLKVELKNKGRLKIKE
jgi:hypothetical protein